jgi:peptidoglycan/xylan/chitin deacetylase (PgdA/CDA1 family)
MRGPFSRCLSILIYHRIVAEPDSLVPDEVSAKEFDWHMKVLARWFNVLPLCEGAARLREGSLPARAACVTFDDGYADNVTVALPILRSRGVPATFFLATGFIDGGRMWNDTVIETVRAAPGNALDARPLGLDTLDIGTLDMRRKAVPKLLEALKYLPLEERQQRVDELSSAVSTLLPSGLMMTSDAVRSLHASGMGIGAHTVNHPILANVAPERARKEILDSKIFLESLTGSSVSLFAYPNGKPGLDYRSEHVQLVKDLGFDAAVSTAHGVAGAASDLFQLPRFTPWDRTPGRFLLRLVQNAFHPPAERV